jgi:hypothetical protein
MLFLLLQINGKAQSNSFNHNSSPVNYQNNSNNRTTVDNSKRTTNNYNAPIYIIIGQDKFQLDKKLNVLGDTLVKQDRSILIVPYLSAGEDIYASLNDPLNFLGISRLTETFIDSGFRIIAYPEKNMVAKLRIPSNTLDDKSQAIYLSGADICVQLGIIKNSNGDDKSMTVTLTAYDRNDGSFITQKVATSREYSDADYNFILDTFLPDIASTFVTKLKHNTQR